MSEPTVNVLAVLRRHRDACPMEGNCDWCAELDGVIAALAALFDRAEYLCRTGQGMIAFRAALAQSGGAP
ncbi:hypothetical protein [Lysobacter enzymogenes]|uniref:hypothetical protein n=1 Tax=Lysobacter enzymogenes TaxID=69 RepID=UPI001AFB7A8E|nr:hypothetical protein [Lysobacter enzymogenes]QQQ03674.1 hypothetical protein JHW41_12360 [Lysobacter enzymogenes]